MKLVNIHMQLTEWCPMSCEGCFQKHNKVHLMDKVNIKDSFRKAYQQVSDLKDFENDSHQYTKRLTFFGGEPLTRLMEIKAILKLIWTEDYQIDEIFIPTSGFGAPDGLRKALVDIRNWTKPETKVIISLSYDGIWNEETRGVSQDKIIKKIKTIDEFCEFPSHVSNVVSEKVLLRGDYDIFQETKDIYDKFNLSGSFTIPHIVSPEFVDAWRVAIANFNIAISEYNPRDVQFPKLFEDIFRMLLGEQGERWCGAGDQHFSIPARTGKLSSCEYLTDQDLNTNWKQKLEENCGECPMKSFCQRPCLKNIEIESDGTSYFQTQCEIRKINILFAVRYYQSLNYVMKLELAKKYNLLKKD